VSRWILSIIRSETDFPTLFLKIYPGIMGYGAKYSQTQNATIIASPKVIVVMTWAEFQGLEVRKSTIRKLLVISSPLDSKKEQSKPSYGENTAEVIDATQNLSPGQPLRVHTRRRPVKDE
jgi:hypothetical protein